MSRVFVAATLVCFFLPIIARRFDSGMGGEGAPPKFQQEWNRHGANDEPGQNGWKPTKGIRTPPAHHKAPAGHNRRRSTWSERHPEARAPDYDEAEAFPKHETAPDAGDDHQSAIKQGKRCSKEAIKHCPVRIMHENFAAFTMCVYDKRENMDQACEEWAHYQGACAAEMLEHCNGRSPEDTTDCLMTKKDDLTAECATSQFFISLEDGYQRHKERREQAKDSSFSFGDMESNGPGGEGPGGDFGGGDGPGGKFDMESMKEMPEFKEMMKKMAGMESGHSGDDGFGLGEGAPSMGGFGGHEEMGEL